MSNQTQNGKPSHPGDQSSLQRLARDIIDLMELQFQLIAVDSRISRAKIAKAIVYAVVAVGLIGSAATVGLIGISSLVDQYTELSIGGSLLVISAITFVLILLLIYLAIRSIRTAVDAMQETKSEFAENLRWLKTTLLNPEASARKQSRPGEFSPAGVERENWFSRERTNT
jgi:uncharacterized membrane protein YqjE